MKKKSIELMENIATYVKTKAEEVMIEKKNKEIRETFTLFPFKSVTK